MRTVKSVIGAASCSQLLMLGFLPDYLEGLLHFNTLLREESSNLALASFSTSTSFTARSSHTNIAIVHIINHLAVLLKACFRCKILPQPLSLLPSKIHTPSEIPYFNRKKMFQNNVLLSQQPQILGSFTYLYYGPNQNYV